MRKGPVRFVMLRVRKLGMRVEWVEWVGGWVGGWVGERERGKRG